MNFWILTKLSGEKVMKHASIFILTTLMAWSSCSNAGSASYFATITRVVADDENFGGCMALTTPGPQSTGLNCGNNFVTFDCDGAFGTKSKAQAKYAGAQLALVTGYETRLVVDDSRTHNGLCLAVRIDNTNAPAIP